MSLQFNKETELLQILIVKKAAEEKGAETHVCSEITTKTRDARTELGYGLEILDTHGFV